MKIQDSFFHNQLRSAQIPFFRIISTVAGCNSSCLRQGVHSFGYRQINYFDNRVLFLRRCIGPIICNMRTIHVSVVLIIHHLGKKSVTVLKEGVVEWRWFIGGKIEAKCRLLYTMIFQFSALLKNLQDSTCDPHI